MGALWKKSKDRFHNVSWFLFEKLIYSSESSIGYYFDAVSHCFLICSWFPCFHFDHFRLCRRCALVCSGKVRFLCLDRFRSIAFEISNFPLLLWCVIRIAISLGIFVEPMWKSLKSVCIVTFIVNLYRNLLASSCACDSLVQFSHCSGWLLHSIRTRIDAFCWQKRFTMNTINLVFTCFWPLLQQFSERNEQED